MRSGAAHREPMSPAGSAPRLGRRPAAAPLALDVVLPVVATTLLAGTNGDVSPDVAVERALGTLACADLTGVTVRCLTCDNGSVFAPELATVLCGVGCGQPPRGDAVASVRDRWVDVVHRARIPEAPVPLRATGLADELASALLIDGDTGPGPHIHRA